MHAKSRRFTATLIFATAGFGLVGLTLAVFTMNGQPVSEQSRLWYLPLTIAGGLLAAAIVRIFESSSKPVSIWEQYLMGKLGPVDDELLRRMTEEVMAELVEKHGMTLERASKPEAGSARTPAQPDLFEKFRRN